MSISILAVDDERFSLENLVQCIRKAISNADVISYRKVQNVKNEMHLDRMDAAFLDINMEDGNGLSLAEWLYKKYRTLKLSLQPDPQSMQLTHFSSMHRVIF